MSLRLKTKASLHSPQISWPVDRPDKESRPERPQSSLELLEAKRFYCPVPDCRYSLPIRAVSDNTREIGICVDSLGYQQMVASVCAKEERKVLTKEEREKKDKKHRAVELNSAAEMERQLEKCAIGDSKVEEMLEKVRQIKEQLGSGECSQAISDQYNEAWTFYLVSTGEDNPDERFNIKLHAMLSNDLGIIELPQGIECTRKRVIWPCLNNQSEAEWEGLRKKCVNGVNVRCEVIDARGEFRVKATLRRLWSESKMQELKRKLSMPDERDRKPLVRLCIIDELCGHDRSFRPSQKDRPSTSFPMLNTVEADEDDVDAMFNSIKGDQGFRKLYRQLAKDHPSQQSEGSSPASMTAVTRMMQEEMRIKTEKQRQEERDENVENTQIIRECLVPAKNSRDSGYLSEKSLKKELSIGKEALAVEELEHIQESQDSEAGEQY